MRARNAQLRINNRYPVSLEGDPGAVHSIVLHASQCHNNCVFCSAKEFGDIVGNVEREIDKLRKSVEAGTSISEVEISGNDPAEYRELPTVVDAIKSLLPNTKITLASHGRVFSDRTFVTQLMSSGVTKFLVPIYGHTSAIHDAVTRVDGSFVETLRGLRQVTTLGGKFAITSLITNENQHCLAELFITVGEFSERLSVGFPYLSSAAVVRGVPDFERLRSQLSTALRTAQSKSRCTVYLRNIPRCLLDYDYPFCEDSSIFPIGAYEHWRNPHMIEKGLVEVIDGNVVPRYRQFQKLPECDRCVASQSCRGFLRTYVEAGLFTARPLGRTGQVDKARI